MAASSVVGGNSIWILIQTVLGFLI